ncbi:hypothetical protein HDV03_002751 [Kappamyces sp. JEL0829]|nr:hypothetical protein HDV03_002751 [Kappamyces sp. JEL0829]
MGRRDFLRPVIAGHAFVAPAKRITDATLMVSWQESEAYLRLLDFLQSCNESVVNTKISDPVRPLTKTLEGILAILKTLDGWIADIPPDTSVPSRFGNIAFRAWMARLHQNCADLHTMVLDASHPAIKELAPYLAGSFGDGTRMDYGSGHELSFIAWLDCLDLMGVLGKDDYPSVVLRVFVSYLDLVRKLQTTYNLEPAGSHGVWGLDDYQFVPYFWGSSQLRDHPKIKPKSVMNHDIVSHFSKDYLYLECIRFINQNKSGPFFEHSPILYDVSGVPLWSKVNAGMLKMYIAEVLLKFPVVQHFLFGSLLPFDKALDLEPPSG